MLTDEGYGMRFWGPLKTLRKLLDGKRIPENYYGLMSTSDNCFNAVSRHLQLSVLVRENKDAITCAVGADPELARQLLDELQELRSMMEAESHRFHEESREVDVIIDNVLRIDSENRRGYPKSSGTAAADKGTPT